MIMLALLVAMQAVPPPPLQDDIVVMARKMRLIEVDMKVRKRGGRLELERCRITRSSGYAELDAIPCDVARQCMLDGPADRKTLARCVGERSQVRLDAVVAARRGLS